MPPKKWDEEESGSESEGSVAPVVGRRKFEDEEDDDVLDSWDAADDSEAEREKEKKAAAAAEKAAAAAAVPKKSKAQRIEEHKLARAQLLDDDDDDDEEETEAEKRERLRRTEKEADLKHAEDLLGDFGNIGISNSRTGKTPGAAVIVDPKDPNNTVNLGALPLFNPQTKLQFETLRTTMAPILAASAKKAHYALFLTEFAKQLAADLPSDQIKKIASSLTALGNEKMKAEKAASGSSKKTKAAKTKTSLVTNRDNAVETQAYDNDDFGDDDFM